MTPTQSKIVLQNKKHYIARSQIINYYQSRHIAFFLFKKIYITFCIFLLYISFMLKPTVVERVADSPKTVNPMHQLK